MNPAVIKIGGALLEGTTHMDAFWHSIQILRENIPVIIVHGGGPQATRMARRLNHEPVIIQGRRITSDLDLSIIQWALCGELNTKLAAEAINYGLPAVGLNGSGGGMVQVEKRPPWTMSGQVIDFGWVGDIKKVIPSLLHVLLDCDFLPIIAPLGIDNDGHLYNVNADTVAQHVAIALRAQLFCLVTDSGGVRRNADLPDSTLSRINQITYEEGLLNGWIRDGMRVKLKVAFEALQSGIQDVFIVSPEDVATRTRGTQIIH